MQRAYILIQAEVGTSTAIAETLSQFTWPEVDVRAADTVIGPYDVIVELEGNDLESLQDGVGAVLKSVPGVRRTTTCLVVNFG